MGNFERNLPSTSKLTDHFQYISFVTSSEDKREIVSQKTASRVNLNGEEISQFYKEVISSPPTTNCPLPTNHENTSRRIQKKKISTPSSNKFTIFHHAQNGNVDGVKHFLSNGCDVDVQDMYGWTPLMCATFEGHFGVVELLIKCGSKLDVKNKQGLTAFDLAMAKNNKTMMELFTSDVVSNSPTEPCQLPDNTTDRKVRQDKKFCESCNCSYTESLRVHERSIAHLFSNQNDSISTYYHIPENNKGFQIMLKKGWDKNKGLGTDAKGRKFPIKTVLKTDRSCIGGKKEISKVTHFGPNDHRSVKKNLQLSLDLKREKKLKKCEVEKQRKKNRQFEIEFRRQFNM